MSLEVDVLVVGVRVRVEVLEAGCCFEGGGVGLEGDGSGDLAASSWLEGDGSGDLARCCFEGGGSGDLEAASWLEDGGSGDLEGF